MILHYIKHSVALLTVLFCITGCTSGHMDFNWAKPVHLDMTPPDGPPEYQQGYVDGCNSGWKAYTTTFNKVWGKYEQDPYLAQNPVYYQIWKDAYAYCSAYAMSNGEHGIMTNDGAGGGVLDVFGKTGNITMEEWK